MSDREKKKAKKDYDTEWRKNNREHMIKTQRAYDASRSEARKEKREEKAKERDEERFWNGPAKDPNTLYEAPLIKKLTMPTPAEVGEMMESWLVSPPIARPRFEDLHMPGEEDIEEAAAYLGFE
jgi:hypothetical protein